jgi:hypothetical protein
VAQKSYLINLSATVLHLRALAAFSPGVDLCLKVGYLWGVGASPGARDFGFFEIVFC